MTNKKKGQTKSKNFTKSESSSSRAKTGHAHKPNLGEWETDDAHETAKKASGRAFRG